MERLDWYVGARIHRDGLGGVSWYVESSDALSAPGLVEDGYSPKLLDAATTVRAVMFTELLRMYDGMPQELPFV